VGHVRDGSPLSMPILVDDIIAIFLGMGIFFLGERGAKGP